MKKFTNCLIILLFILAAVKTADAQQTYTVSGKVRYLDNNEIVTRGKVKFYDLQGHHLGSASINENGDYIKAAMVSGEVDIIGFPNLSEEEDFIPTGYPNVLNAENYTHVVVTDNITGIDIYVHRRSHGNGGMPYNNFSSISGKVLSNDNMPVSDAIIYAMRGNEYLGFGVSDAKGEYKINSIPTGDYILVVQKIGSKSESKKVNLNEEGLDNINFSISQKVKEINTPYGFKLAQNYPNPFNPSTVISYSIPENGFVSLKVYNTAGQLIEVLFNGNQNAGAYTVEFNADNLSTGVYYYSLVSGGLVTTRKMILVK